jgi:hypothetical protein
MNVTGSKKETKEGEDPSGSVVYIYTLQLTA